MRLDPALTQSRHPKPFGGVYLETACKLDSACPGSLNRILHASSLTRSAQFAAYAEIDFSQPEIMAARRRTLAPPACEPSLDPVAQVARALILLSPRSVVQSIYGSVPEGLLGLLARLGGDPLPNPADYPLAYSLFAEPAHKARAKLLRQTEGQISPGTIKVVARLDPILLHKAVLARACDLERAEALNAAVALIRALVPDATDEALRQSLKGLSPSDRTLSKWVMGWLVRMQRVPVSPPIPAGDPDLRLLQGCDMAELGRRFQNCAADRVGYIAAGSRLYYEWLQLGGPVVVELRALARGHFVIEDIKAPRNAEPDAAVADAIRARLSAAGVLSFTGPGRSGAGEALMHLLGAWDYDFREPGEPEAFLAGLLNANSAACEAT